MFVETLKDPNSTVSFLNWNQSFLFKF